MLQLLFFSIKINRTEERLLYTYIKTTLMITTSTSTYNTNQFHPKSDQFNTELFEETDSFFYEALKSELDFLIREPSDEVIEKILAYAKAKL